MSLALCLVLGALAFDALADVRDDHRIRKVDGPRAGSMESAPVDLPAPEEAPAILPAPSPAPTKAVEIGVPIGTVKQLASFLERIARCDAAVPQAVSVQGLDPKDASRIAGILDSARASAVSPKDFPEDDYPVEEGGMFLRLAFNTNRKCAAQVPLAVDRIASALAVSLPDVTVAGHPLRTQAVDLVKAYLKGDGVARLKALAPSEAGLLKLYLTQVVAGEAPPHGMPHWRWSIGVDGLLALMSEHALAPAPGTSALAKLGKLVVAEKKKGGAVPATKAGFLDAALFAYVDAFTHGGNPWQPGPVSASDPLSTLPELLRDYLGSGASSQQLDTLYRSGNTTAYDEAFRKYKADTIASLMALRTYLEGRLEGSPPSGIPSPSWRRWLAAVLEQVTLALAAAGSAQPAAHVADRAAFKAKLPDFFKAFQKKQAMAWQKDLLGLDGLALQAELKTRLDAVHEERQVAPSHDFARHAFLKTLQREMSDHFAKHFPPGDVKFTVKQVGQGASKWDAATTLAFHKAVNAAVAMSPLTKNDLLKAYWNHGPDAKARWQGLRDYLDYIADLPRPQVDRLVLLIAPFDVEKLRELRALLLLSTDPAAHSLLQRAAYFFQRLDARFPATPTPPAVALTHLRELADLLDDEMKLEAAGSGHGKELATQLDWTLEELQRRRADAGKLAWSGYPSNGSRSKLEAIAKSWTKAKSWPAEQAAWWRLAVHTSESLEPAEKDSLIDILWKAQGEDEKWAHERAFLELIATFARPEADRLVLGLSAKEVTRLRALRGRLVAAGEPSDRALLAATEYFFSRLDAARPSLPMVADRIKAVEMKMAEAAQSKDLAILSKLHAEREKLLVGLHGFKAERPVPAGAHFFLKHFRTHEKEGSLDREIQALTPNDIAVIRKTIGKGASPLFDRYFPEAPELELLTQACDAILAASGYQAKEDVIAPRLKLLESHRAAWMPRLPPLTRIWNGPYYPQSSPYCDYLRSLLFAYDATGPVHVVSDDPEGPAPYTYSDNGDLRPPSAAMKDLPQTAGAILRDLPPGDVIHLWDRWIHAEQGAKARAAVAKEIAASPSAKRKADAAIAKAMAERKADFIARTPCLDAMKREQAAPWLFGKYDRFRPEIEPDGKDGLRVVVVPTAKTQALQMAQALHYGAKTWGNFDERSEMASRVTAFHPPLTPAEAEAWWLHYGDTPPEQMNYWLVVESHLQRDAGEYAAYLTQQATSLPKLANPESLRKSLEDCHAPRFVLQPQLAIAKLSPAPLDSIKSGALVDSNEDLLWVTPAPALFKAVGALGRIGATLNGAAIKQAVMSGAKMKAYGAGLGAAQHGIGKAAGLVEGKWELGGALDELKELVKAAGEGAAVAFPAHFTGGGAVLLKKSAVGVLDNLAEGHYLSALAETGALTHPYVMSKLMAMGKGKAKASGAPPVVGKKGSDSLVFAGNGKGPAIQKSNGFEKAKQGEPLPPYPAEKAKHLAKELNLKALSPFQLEVLNNAHWIGHGEPGKLPGTQAGILPDGQPNYTRGQLRRKYHELVRVGANGQPAFTHGQAMHILRNLYAGTLLPTPRFFAHGPLRTGDTVEVLGNNVYLLDADRLPGHFGDLSTLNLRPALNVLASPPAAGLVRTYDFQANGIPALRPFRRQGGLVEMNLFVEGVRHPDLRLILHQPSGRLWLWDHDTSVIQIAGPDGALSIGRERE